MKESMWGYAIIVLGILAIGIIWFFANTTKTDQHNYNLLKETTEAAMLDAVDLAAYRQDGTVKIEEEKFVESFVRRFAENADLSNEYYKIEIYDINETPPKVSLKVSSSSKTNATGQIIDFDVVNNIDAILETKYAKDLEAEIEETEEENTNTQPEQTPGQEGNTNTQPEGNQSQQTTNRTYTKELTATVYCRNAANQYQIVSGIIPNDSRITGVAIKSYDENYARHVTYNVSGNRIRFSVYCRRPGNVNINYIVRYKQRV